MLQDTHPIWRGGNLGLISTSKSRKMDAGDTVAEDDRRSAPSEWPTDAGETVAEVDRRSAPPGNYAENAGDTVAKDDRRSAPPGTGITVC